MRWATKGPALGTLPPASHAVDALKRWTKLLSDKAFCVIQQLIKKDGRGILKGEYSPSKKYIKGFPLERFFAHFLCDKESGGRAA